MTASSDPAPASGAALEVAMHLVYDARTDVAYLRLRQLRQDELLGPTLLLETDREFPGALALDFSLDDGRVVGLEFGMASLSLPAELLAAAERADGTNAERRLEERILRRLAAGMRGASAPRRPGVRRH